MFNSVSSQIVAQQNTNNLCYENVLFSSPKYRAESNVKLDKINQYKLRKVLTRPSCHKLNVQKARQNN